MSTEVFNRYETKYLINTAQYHLLSNRLQEYMHIDEYHRDNSFYTICNIYYDTADNYLIRNSLDKPTYKEKLRLRSYGIPANNQQVYLEIKKKYNGIVNKRRTLLTIGEVNSLINSGIYPTISQNTNEQVIKELSYFISIYDISPKVYIAYDRQAFIGNEDSSLRITFDTNIRTRRYDLSLEKGDYGSPLINKGVWLMEIKCSASLPIWLADLLSANKIYKTSFSKYGTEYMRYLNQLKEDEKYA